MKGGTKLFENVTYDSVVNACYITLKTNVEIDDTVEKQPDCWVDIDADGDIIGIEILNADQHFNLINKILLSQMPVEECV